MELLCVRLAILASWRLCSGFRECRCHHGRERLRVKPRTSWSSSPVVKWSSGEMRSAFPDSPARAEDLDTLPTRNRGSVPRPSYYAALVARGKPKNVALTAVCCRLVRLLYALVRDGRCYSECPPEAVRPQAA